MENKKKEATLDSLSELTAKQPWKIADDLWAGLEIIGEEKSKTDAIETFRLKLATVDESARDDVASRLVRKTEKLDQGIRLQLIKILIETSPASAMKTLSDCLLLNVQDNSKLSAFISDVIQSLEWGRTHGALKTQKEWGAYVLTSLEGYISSPTPNLCAAIECLGNIASTSKDSTDLEKIKTILSKVDTYKNPKVNSAHSDAWDKYKKARMSALDREDSDEDDEELTATWPSIASTRTSTLISTTTNFFSSSAPSTSNATVTEDEISTPVSKLDG